MVLPYPLAKVKIAKNAGGDRPDHKSGFGRLKGFFARILGTKINALENKETKKHTTISLEKVEGAPKNFSLAPDCHGHLAKRLAAATIKVG